MKHTVISTVLYVLVDDLGRAVGTCRARIGRASERVEYGFRGDAEPTGPAGALHVEGIAKLVLASSYRQHVPEPFWCVA